MPDKKLFNLTILQKQIILGIIISCIVTTIIALILIKIIPTSKTSQESSSSSTQYKNQIEVVGQKIDSESMWRYNQEAKIRDLKESLSAIESDLIKARDNNIKIEEPNNLEIEMLKRDILSLKEMMNDGKDGNLNHNTNIDAQNPVVKINKVKIELSDTKPGVGVKNKADTIPAGSFARAVILGGLDASTALSASSDPRPLLIRLVDHGTLPSKFKGDLQDCHIVASGYGDLSSERVFARLEKLTCVECNSGEIVETEVAGYVAGEDGRAGIRGIVVEKGRGYIGKSIMGGLLQGMAGVLMPDRAVVSNPISTFFLKRKASEKFNEGAISGIGSSMDRLSKYYIERAESIQPVIQIESGRTVDVIFTEGSDIGTAKVKEKLRIKREYASNQLTEDQND